MCTQLYKEDLQFLYDKLNKHPSIKINQQLNNEFTKLFETLIDKVNVYKIFIDSMTTLRNIPMIH